MGRLRLDAGDVPHRARGDMTNDVYYFTFIVGGEKKPRGCGKTTLVGHFATERMTPPWSLYDVAMYRKEVGDLRVGGWDNIEIDDNVKHTVYVADDTFTSKSMGYEPQISMELKFDELGLFDGTKPVTHIVPYSLICIPEVQSKLDSRKSMTDAPADNLLRFIELQRKFGVRMIADAQLYYSVEKRLRETADLVIEVQEQTHKYSPFDPDKRSPIETTWHCYEFLGARAYERYYASGDLKHGRKVTYTHKGNIFDCIDSFNGKERFLDGMGNKSFDAVVAKPTGNDKVAMLEKCKKFPLTKPKTIKEKTSYGQN